MEHNVKMCHAQRSALVMPTEITSLMSMTSWIRSIISAQPVHSPPNSSRGNVPGYHTAAQKKALISQAASNQGAACFGAHVCAHNEALGCASERVSGHQANMNPALNAPERTRTRVPGFEPGTFGFVDRCSIQLSYTRGVWAVGINGRRSRVSGTGGGPQAAMRTGLGMRTRMEKTHLRAP